jgi:predicted MFS family arabinose efflux permease
MPLVDEIVAGLPVATLAQIRDDLRLGYDEVGLLFTAGQIAGAVAGPAIQLLTGRSRRGPIVVGALGLALAFALAARAHGFVALSAAFTLAYIAGSAALGLSETTLVEIAPDTDRALARWTLFAALGDVLSPLLVAAAVAIGLGWRHVFGVAALSWALVAAALARAHFPNAAPVSEEGEPGPIESLKVALGERELLRWAGVALLCHMLDEVFLGFAGLHLRDAVGLGPSETAWTLAAFVAGTLAGLSLLERFRSGIRVERALPGLALLVLLAISLFLGARTAGAAALWLFVAGAAAGPWYPLALARCHATLPGRAAIVAVVTGLGAPLELATPVIAGLLAERWGVPAAVGFLGLAPLGVIALSARATASED